MATGTELETAHRDALTLLGYVLNGQPDDAAFMMDALDEFGAKLIAAELTHMLATVLIQTDYANKFGAINYLERG